jgi:hypothetical protein
VIGHPPAAGGGVKSRDLPAQIFDFWAMSDYSDEDDQMQQAILDRIPSQIEGLRMKREGVETAPAPEESTIQPPAPTPRWWWLRLVHEPNPWVLAIGGAVIAGAILWLVFGSP